MPSPLSLASQEWVFRALALGVGILALAMLVFAVVVIVLRLKHARTARDWAQREARWEATLLAVLAGDAAPQSLRDDVRQSERRDFIEYLVRFARRVKGREREQLQELAAPFLAVLEPDLSHRRADRRARAVQTLGDLGFVRYQEPVIAALDDEAPLVRMIAARALTRPEHPDQVGLVLEKLHLFPTWSPNFLAAMLADAGMAAVPALRAALGDPAREAPVRAIAATALTYLGDLEAADVAVTVLGGRHDVPDLLASSLRLIAKLGRPEHAAAVRPLIDSGHFAVRAAAISALGAIGGPDDLAAIREGYDDASPWVAMHAARALVDAGDVRSLEEIVARRHSRASLAIQVLSELEEE